MNTIGIMDTLLNNVVTSWKTLKKVSNKGPSDNMSPKRAQNLRRMETTTTIDEITKVGTTPSSGTRHQVIKHPQLDTTGATTASDSLYGPTT